MTESTLAKLADSPILAPVLDEALGRAPIDEPAEPGTGGPAGNGRLTSVLGALLIVGIVAQLITVLDVRGLISWHFGIGVALVALVGAKVVTTGYTIVRYYTGSPVYRRVGAPPTLLRLLGPLLVLLAGLALWSGIYLALSDENAARSPLFTVLGQRLDWITLHQVSVWTWVALVAVHLLARFVPMVRRLRRPNVPGVAWRALFLVVTLAASVVAAKWGIDHVGTWGQGGFGRGPGDVRG